MRFTRARSRRHPLRFEQLEDRVVLSASIGSLKTVAMPTMAAMKKSLGYSHPVGLTPIQVRNAYSFNNIDFGGVPGDGAGQTIAIIDARNDPTIASDLAVFDQTFGLPAPPSFTVVNQAGGVKLPKSNRSWAQEIAIDVEWAHAIAPAANILLVEAKTSSDLSTAIDYARHVPGVSVISVSADGKEFNTEALADELLTTPPGHVGITFVFASGDEGAKAEYPSASPYVLSVGGTSLHVSSSGQYLGESVWEFGGGGLSKYEGVPSYQNGLGLTSRATPDVTYDADPDTGFAVFDTYGSGGWAQFGGTSIGAPQWAALIAIANQGRVLAGKEPLANAQAALYSLPATDFHDIVSGGNGALAKPGYDLASGLGSPIANRLIPDLVAYNGSTDFTVAPPASATKKKPKHTSLGTLTMGSAIATPGVVAQSSVTISSANVTNDAKQTLASLATIPTSNTIPKSTMPLTDSKSATTTAAKLSDDAMIGIDAFFTGLTG